MHARHGKLDLLVPFRIQRLGDGDGGLTGIAESENEVGIAEAILVFGREIARLEPGSAWENGSQQRRQHWTHLDDVCLEHEVS